MLLKTCNTSVAAGLLLVVAQTFAAAAEVSEQEIGQQVDQVLLQAYRAEGVEPAGIVPDEDFLRRVTLDLTGKIPSPRDVTLFGLDPDPAKRSKLIDRLLESEDFAATWASYWREVIFLRATEQRGRLAQPAFEQWLKEQFEKGESWGEITRELITATGPVQENGATGLIFAHTGDPQELTAEISRIFLGIQLSCANCHDHPTDSWKREEFHQLAAFLPRIAVRRADPQDPRSFTITSADNAGQRGRGERDLSQILRFLDRNRDGKLAKSEARGPLADRFDQLLGLADTDKDGMLSTKELENARPPMNQQPGRGSAEYYMPDLNDPSSQGTLMQPAFFIAGVSGPKLRPGADDQQRRQALANYITSKSNPWFAKSFVNRVWGELLGEGFYMPIDDMGPERGAQMEQALVLLADGFAQSNYNVRWLYRTIMNTQAYQRQMRHQSPAEPEPAFASATPTRLRADQLYNSITEILGGGSFAGRFRGRGPYGMMARGAGIDPARFAFSQLFGFDPSTPQEDLIGNVPQALFMMNSPQVNSALSASGNTRLANLLREFSDDRDALNEVYLLVLTREPTERETEINLAYIKETGNRGEAFEDILWSLLNSTEFQSKR